MSVESAEQTAVATPVELARTTTLWNLDSELQRLFEQAKVEEELEGSVQPETMAALQAYFSATVQKVDRIAEWMKAQESQIADIKAEIERLEGFLGPEQNALNRCKQMLKEFLSSRGIRQVKGRLNKITLCNNGGHPPMKPIADPSLLPEQYRLVNVVMTQREWDNLGVPAKRVEPFVDEVSVRAALCRGESVQGAELDQRGQHIRA
jgi:hypothetical protein